MDKFAEQRISSRELFQGRLLRVRIDTVKVANGLETTREIVEHPGAVAIVAVTAEKEIVLVRQFRTPTGEVLLELPAGVPHQGEQREGSARRELAEETGYHAKNVRKIWEGYASPGYSNELIEFFLATDLELKSPSPDEDEFVEPELIGVAAAVALVRQGEIRDNKTMIGIMIADLFLKGELK
ncbi:MAG: NUDIX hydrolase [Candidatus Margulisbacteria bacterium]|nr:NUDIX hydrolase [Candidatus Margulisiibacteriota bacterium]